MILIVVIRANILLRKEDKRRESGWRAWGFASCVKSDAQRIEIDGVSFHGDKTNTETADWRRRNP